MDRSYDKNGKKKTIMITPDDLILIFSYIVIKSNVYTLYSQIQLTDDFVVSNLRMEMPGYYMATINAALQTIVTDHKKLNELANKITN